VFIVCRSTKIQFFSQAVFQRATIDDFGEDDVSRIVAHFNSPTEIVSEGLLPDFDAVVNHFRQRVEQFTRRGSGYFMERVRQLGVCFVKFRPLDGSAGSFVKNKTAVVNLQNSDDDYCFVGRFQFINIRRKLTRTAFRLHKVRERAEPRWIDHFRQHMD